jgi:CelD/BcsL family acetyltransferase involved in cellulose biosynthesis
MASVRSLDDPDWLRLVHGCPDATAFHLPAWSQAVAETYGFRPFVFVMEGVGRSAVAGQPVMEVRDLIGRRRLVSLPFTDHCPPLVAAGGNAGEFARSLVQAGIEVRAELPVVSGALAERVGTKHLVDLQPDPDVLFRRLHRNRIQKRVRRAREQGVEVKLSRSISDLESFYRLHCQTRQRQGVPVQPRRFIRSIWEKVIEAGHGFVIMASADGMPIATALFLTWNRHLIYKYGASDRRHWRLGANFLVHWTAMEWGCVNGYRTYDFGRTDAGHESLREFKAAWSSTEVPLVYTHVGARPEAPVRGKATELMSRIIRHSPTLVCRTVGELFYRYAA